MDAMDEFQEADILWPEDELLSSFTPMDMEEFYHDAGSVVSSIAPVFGRRFEGFFVSGAGPGASRPDAVDDEEWQEADVLWPDTADEPRGMWQFSGSSGGGGGIAGRLVKPDAARRDGWSTGPAASSPINIPANVARVVGLRRR